MGIDKATITRNFSRRAYSYDKYADIQKRAASGLLDLLETNNIKNILELGCGTGNYTYLLREKFSATRLLAVDISAKMVEVACGKFLPALPVRQAGGRQGKNNGIEFMVQDAEALDLDEKFDLITSNACFQWFDDLDGAFRKYSELLNKEGVVLFSIFGPETLLELSASLKFLFKNAALASDKFMTKQEILGMMRKYFRKIQVREFRYTESFSCLRELLNKIKYTGIRGEGLNGKLLLTPGSLKKLEEVYLNKFGQIKATYQVFLCSGQK